ncbi:MAG: ribonuclease III [Patescibacteria group bacterium]|nr:ribonuclease III [Patescibacteria group bacterium]
MDLEKLEKKIDLTFKNKTLARNAFVHRSYLNEHPDFELSSNERLEFLGDAVLELATSEKLFRKYPNKPEGNLTNIRAALVCTVSLAEESKRLGLGNYLFLSKGEDDSGGREREYILANTFEAFLGAIYLDQGYKTCQNFLEKNLFYKVDEIVKNRKYKDAKSTLQEIAQEEQGITPTYKVLEEWGPDHAKNFRMGVFLNDKQIGGGEGNSKQEGEQAAAQDALERWQ